MVEEGGDAFGGELVESVCLGEIKGLVLDVAGVVGIGEGIGCCCCVGGRVEVEVCVCVVPIVERVVDVSFEICHRAAVRAHELGVGFIVIKQWADALEMPNMRAGRDK